MEHYCVYLLMTRLSVPTVVDLHRLSSCLVTNIWLPVYFCLHITIIPVILDFLCLTLDRCQ